jgi:hypothetical protein
MSQVVEHEVMVPCSLPSGLPYPVVTFHRLKQVSVCPNNHSKIFLLLINFLILTVLEKKFPYTKPIKSHQRASKNKKFEIEYLINRKMKLLLKKINYDNRNLLGNTNCKV